MTGNAVGRRATVPGDKLEVEVEASQLTLHVGGVRC